VPRRVTLFALWAVFAVASVSVGFAAASVVSDPFTDVSTTSDVPDLAEPGDSPVTEPGAAASTSPSTHKPTPTTTPGNSSTVKRGISTRGGYVSATCRGGLVSVGAAPSVYWQVESYTPGRLQTGRVRLQPAHDANGERVEVTASCPGGTPAFTTSYSDGSGGGGGDGGGHGGGDGGGDSGSGGSDGSSGSGD
jgi:hypothetical protein